MSEHTYKMIELVGSSHTSIEEAVKNAVSQAAIDEKSLRWFADAMTCTRRVPSTSTCKYFCSRKPNPRRNDAFKRNCWNAMTRRGKGSPDLTRHPAGPCPAR